MEENKIKFYKLCEEAEEYANVFFKELCNTCGNPAVIKDDILPLVFRDVRELEVRGRFTNYNKQICILFGIDTKRTKIVSDMKRTLRHEIIHYFLWAMDMPYDDDSLEFWCLSYMFDGGAYKKLSKNNKVIYDVFKKDYDDIVRKYGNLIHKTFIGKFAFQIICDVISGEDYNVAKNKAIEQIEDIKKYF